ncbi:MAG: choice-of-anchor Q domain-containing protein [Vicinamibacterales bacterium]|nr:choice-of-anchor Q domain-containing protein [Vicinamibacterales bacterium]
MRILGAGADTTFIGPEDLDTSSHGVLQFDDRMTLHVEGVTIQHGNAASGGGINFNQIVVLTLLDSHIRLNQAQRGTAINFNQDTTFTIRGTTISENVDTSLSGKAGAIAFNNFGRGALINTTIVGNEGQSAVALFSNNRSEIELVNSTIAGSVATPGSSLVSQIDFQNASALTLLNSIVVAPAGVVCATPTSPGDPPWAFSNGFNLISDASCNLFGPGDLQGTADPRLNPVLWPNGGTTPTLALLPGSDAIDAGFDFIDGFPYFVTTDQRGIPRPQGVHYDIGAYEYMGDMTPPVVTPPANLVGVEATGPDGRSAGQPPISMPFLNGATAEDDVDGPINPTEILNDVTEPFFPLGTTTVEFSAEDSSGNVGTATATVEVVDTTPPVITVPIDIPIPATSPDGKAYVDYSG